MIKTKQITKDDVTKSLNGKGKLSSALKKLQKFAESNGYEELAKWCLSELQGYEEGENLDYRKISHHTEYEVNLFLQPPNIQKTCFVCVETIEDYIKTNAHLDIKIQLSPLLTFSFAKEKKQYIEVMNLKKLLDKIKQKALINIENKTTDFLMPNFQDVVNDDNFIKTLSRRWEEANLTFKAEAWLATVVLLGSVLEGILLEKMFDNPEKANRATKCPKQKLGRKDIKDWTFKELIEVAVELGFISDIQSRLSTIIQEYRNFIHPNKEVNSGKKENPFDEAACRTLFGVFNNLLITMKKT
jgi:AbiTii